MATELNFLINAKYKAKTVFKDAKGDIEELDRAADKSSGGNGGLGKLQSLLGTGLKVAAGAAVAGISALGVAIASSVNKAADLEEQMSGIAAVLGKTKEEVAPLKDLILKLGIDPKLKVSATEAADAIEMLARNGLDMSEIMDGAARSTVLLANATNADFGTAADIATDVMAQFNIEAKDMSQAVNGITSVVNNSKFSIDDYRLALAQGGGVAATVGVSFDDFNASIAAISPLFASGSDAGTSFKVFLQNLVPKSNAAADTMRRLGLFSGLTTEEFEKLQGKIHATEQKIAALDPTSKNYQENLEKLNNELAQQRKELVAGNSAFFDQNGNMEDMSVIAGALQRALGGLSDEQKNEALSTIFGTDAMRAAAAMAEFGEEKFSELKATMGQTDAEAAAATRVDNLRGALEILSGIVETLQLKIGEKFIPVVRQMVEAFSLFVEQHSDDIVAVFEGIANGISLVVDNIGVIMDALGELAANFVTFNFEAYDTTEAIEEVARLFGMSSEQSIALGETIFSLSQKWQSFLEAVKALAQPIIDAIGSFISWKDVLGALAVVAGAALASVVASAAPVIAMAAGLVAAVATVRNAWESDWGGIRTIITAAAEIIMRGINDVIGGFRTWQEVLGEWAGKAGEQIAAWGRALWDWITANLPTWIAKLGEWAAAAWQWIANAAVVAVQKLGEWAGQLYQYIADNLTNWRGTLQTWGNAAADWISNNETLTRLRGNLQTWRQSLFTWYNDNAPTGSEFLAWVTGIVDWIADAAPMAIDNLADMIVSMVDWLLGPGLDGFLAGMGNMFSNVDGDGANHPAAKLILAIGRMAAKVSVALVEAAGRIGWAIISGIIEAFIPGAETVHKAIETFVGKMWDSFKHFLGIASPSTIAYDLGWNLVQGLINGFNAVMDGFVGSHIPSVLSGLMDRIRGGVGSLADVGRNMVQGLIDGFNAKMDEFVRHMSGTADYIKDTFKSLFGINSPSTVFADFGENLMQGLRVGMDAGLGDVMRGIDIGVGGIAGRADSIVNNNQRSTSNTYNVAFQGAGGPQTPDETARLVNMLNNMVTVPV